LDIELFGHDVAYCSYLPFGQWPSGPEQGGHVSIDASERLLTPGEVALMFRVDPKTVTRWASAGRIGSIRTPGGHRRFRETEVRSLLNDLTIDAARTSA
jgi:excisionase family DNA binding protein